LASVLYIWSTCSALTPRPEPIGTEPMSVAVQCVGMIPLASCGKLRPECSPRPNFWRYAASRFAPSCWATWIVPMFDDWVRMSVIDHRIGGWFSWSEYVWL